MFLALAIGSFCIAFALALGLNWLALIPWRRSAGRHWTERARLLYPAQKSARLNNWVIPFLLGLMSYLWFPGIHFLYAGIAGFIGALSAGYFLNREAFPNLQFGQWFRLIVAGVLLFFFWWFVLIFAAFDMPDNFGATTWCVATGIFILFVAFQSGMGLLLLRWLGLLHPATQNLKTLVAEVSQQMHVSVRSTWILDTFLSNAAAFPHSRQLVFTGKLLSTATDEEIKAICAHELGHLNESRTVLLARTLAAFVFYPLIFARPFSSLGRSGINVYFFLMTGSLILFLTGVRVARRMEKRADKIAAENLTDTAVYAQALERLYETNRVPAVTPLRTPKIHPDLYDRMVAAGVKPDFPKPLPPKSQCWTSRLLIIVAAGVPIGGIFMKAFMAAWTTMGVH
ncbi:MAG TPA: M56 family metallopeptidase [Verrucomicrobiae bacterium]|nr:M56 family metallopeptidase [Verrucomicrobiae bacterium]